MIFKEKIQENKLNKEYSTKYKKIRRKIVDLYRPININSKNLFVSKIDIMTYIMFILFSISASLFLFNIEYEYVPFLLGFFLNLIFMIYLKVYPLSWNEMYDYEKKIYRDLFYLPKDWEPKK